MSRNESFALTHHHRTFSPFQSKWAAYPDSLLHTWQPAPTVLKAPGATAGEMGNSVLIPKEREEEKKEKFKINQFNLLASEMISLNRSLQDVRLAA